MNIFELAMLKKNKGGGSGGGGKTLIIKEPNFELAKTIHDPEDPVWEELWALGDEWYFGAFTTNMSFNDALSAFRNCELLGATIYKGDPALDYDNNECIVCRVFAGGVMDFSAMCTCDCLYIKPCNDSDSSYFWTADGFVLNPPFKEVAKPE